jgi:hypothetical protein
MSNNYRELILLSALAFVFHMAGGTKTHATVLARPALVAQVQATNSSLAQFRDRRPALRRVGNLQLPATAPTMSSNMGSAEVAKDGETSPIVHNATR